MPPHFRRSPNTPDQERSSNLRLPSRRAFLKGALSTAALVATDSTIGNVVWKGDDPIVTELSDRQAANRHPNTAWFWLGGFGKRSTEDIATNLHPAARESGRSFAVDYGKNGIDPSAVSRAIVRACQEQAVDTAYLYAHSAAGIPSPVIAHNLTESGINVPLLVHDCSPSDKFDVWNYANQFGLELFSRADSVTDFAGRVTPGLDETDIKFGPGIRTIFELGSRVVPMAQGELSVKEAWRQSIEKISPYDTPNSLILSTARLIERADPQQSALLIPSKTNVVRLQPVEHTPPLDNVINNQRAYAGMQYAMGNHPYYLYELGYSGHANPNQEPTMYQKAIREVIARFSLD